MKKIFTVILILALLFTSCAVPGEDSAQSGAPPASESGTAQSTGTAAEPLPPEPPSAAALVAVGDNLLHNTVITAAKIAAGYDFTPMYAPVRSLIMGADIAFVNQEAPIGGEGFSPSGYPNFNSPGEAGRDLLRTGFNVINQANNHAMDKGQKAVMGTIDFWSGTDALMVGMYRDQADREKARVIEKNGIRVGFLSYTYGTNGIPVPSDKPFLIPLIERDKMISELKAMRGQCDVLAVSMHWGNEYTHVPTREQKELAGFLTENGADLIIGHHPHVIQPAEWVEAGGRKAFCAYSLGNFISAQEKLPTMLGGMLMLEITKTPGGDASIENPRLMPLVTHYENGGTRFAVYPLSDYTPALAAKHRLNALGISVTLDYFKKTSAEIFGGYLYV